MKNINKILLIALVGLPMGLDKVAAADTTTANLTERWTSSDAGWVVKDEVASTTRAVNWTNGAVGVKFSATAIEAVPKTEIVRVAGAQGASSGCFVGNYNLNKIESVSFDVQTANLKKKPKFYFISSGGSKWYVNLVDVPESTGVIWQRKVIPFVFSDAWTTDRSLAYRKLENFEADKADVVEIGVLAERYTYPAQQIFIDNMKLIGPWLGSFTNDMSVAWLQENNLSPSEIDSDGDGFSNASEFLAGTNPNDSNSFFRVTIERNAAGKMVVKWDENKYVLFDLLQSENLGDSGSFRAVANATDLQGSGAQRAIEVIDSGAGVKFFKVLIKSNPNP